MCDENVSVPVKFEWYMTNFETEVATCIGNSHLRYQRGNVWSAKLGRDKHNLCKTGIVYVMRK